MLLSAPVQEKKQNKPITVFPASSWGGSETACSLDRFFLKSHYLLIMFSISSVVINFAGPSVKCLLSQPPLDGWRSAVNALWCQTGYCVCQALSGLTVQIDHCSNLLYQSFAVHKCRLVIHTHSLINSVNRFPQHCYLQNRYRRPPCDSWRDTLVGGLMLH